MKNTLKSLAGVLLLTLTLQSCSTENEESASLNALEAELAMDHTGTLSIDATTYVFKTSGVTSKFIQSTREFDFSYINALDYTVEHRDGKHAGEEIIVSNPYTDEFIKFTHFEILKSGSLKFDYSLSTGQSYKSVIYKTSKDFEAKSQKWHEEFSTAATPEVIGAVIEISHPGLSNACKNAIKECAHSGGKPSLSLKMENAWFASPETCEVVCN